MKKLSIVIGFVETEKKILLLFIIINSFSRKASAKNM